ncbi:MAG TPA: glycosyltransferase [Blastocatellia bacterium]|nr:glycosyltransferase [Blastocatellia bacterium]
MSIIAPCKGRDDELEQNLKALFRQDHPDFEILLAVASEDDPAREVIDKVISANPGVKSRIVVAGPSSGRSQKINNLLAAIRLIDEQIKDQDSQVLVFFDSDARPRENWLRSLIGPLSEPEVAVTTGYRWYLPLEPNCPSRFWAVLLSAWNAAVATTLGDHGRNFAWGGSTAIRLETFRRIHVADRWQSALSDDYAMTTAVQQSGLKIRFVPQCLLVTREDPSFLSLLEFTTRQMIITRVYRPRAWWVGMISYLLFNLGFWASVALIPVTSRVTAFANNPPSSFAVMVALTALIYLLGCGKGLTRVLGALKALPEFASEIKSLWWAYCIAWPLVSLVFLYNFLRSAVTRRIVWRGVRYEMRSPSETIVL